MVGRLFTVLALAVVLAACGGQSVSPTPSGAQPVAGAGAWQLVGNFPVDGASQVRSIVANGAGFVAVGTLENDDATCSADLNHGRVWTSADGLAWASMADDAFAQTDLTQLVAFHDGLYAFGTSGTFDDETGCGSAANPAGVNVWRSGDGGATWQRLAQATEIARAQIGEVAVAREQLVLVGSKTDQDGNDQAATWSSPDALVWTPAELPPATSFLGSAAARDNVVVGFGFDEDFPLPWISRDGGGHWYEESIDVSGAPSGEELGLGIEDVIATTSGYFAVGQACCPGTAQVLPLTLSTPDGTQWRGAPVASDVPQAMRLIGQLPAGLLAVGIRTYLGDAAPPAGELGGRSWTSADGKAWLPGPSFVELGDGNVTAMAVGSAGVVVAGTTFTETSSSGSDTGLRVWYAPFSAFAGGASN